MRYNEEFLQLYKQFEDWAKEHYPKMQDMHYLENNYSLQDYVPTLKFYRHVRNILSHNGQVGNTPVPDLVNVTQAMVKEFNSFTENIKQPAINKAVTIDHIISYSPSDKVMKAIKDMVAYNFTHCPILNDGKIIGLFGEKSLMNIINEGIIVNQDTTFSEIMNHINIYKCDIARSIPPSTTIPECKYKFTRAIEQNLRLDILFFTDDGTYKTPLKALTTIWDMPVININTTDED